MPHGRKIIYQLVKPYCRKSFLSAAEENAAGTGQTLLHYGQEGFFNISGSCCAAGFIMKKFFVICAIAALVIAGAVSQRAFLLNRYGQFFTVNSGTRGADALVVLAGGILTRLPRAIELYQQGYAPRIILTEQRQHYPALRHVCGDEWLIAPSIIEELHAAVTPVYLPSLKPGGVTSTFDEAYDLRDYSIKNHFQSSHHCNRQPPYPARPVCVPKSF